GLPKDHAVAALHLYATPITGAGRYTTLADVTRSCCVVGRRGCARVALRPGHLTVWAAVIWVPGDRERQAAASGCARACSYSGSGARSMPSGQASVPASVSTVTRAR